MEFIIPPHSGNERLLSLVLNTHVGKFRVINVYAPTLNSTSEAKDSFYGTLDKSIRSTPANEQIIILGDFNARVGADNIAWPSILGKFGIGKVNENGQRLLELCCYHDLSVANTFTNAKLPQKVSWQHPRSKHWHQIDLILIKHSSLKLITYTRTLQSADCDTDHSLVCCKLGLKAKRIHHTKSRPKLRIDTVQTRSYPKVQKFGQRMESCLTKNIPNSSSEKWDYLKDCIHQNAIEIFGRKTKKSHDWFEENIDILMPLLETKRRALMKLKASNTKDNEEAYKLARQRVSKEARKCANAYWTEIANQIQESCDRGDSKRMYEGIKLALGPSIKKSAPLRSSSGQVITDKSQQMNLWVNHFKKVYADRSSFSQTAIDSLVRLPALTELDNDISKQELKEALNHLPPNKSPGQDAIPAEVLKCCGGALFEQLYELLCSCWDEGFVPQSMRDSNIVTIFKRKGDMSDCNNYRGISLLSTAGKLFAKVALNRLQTLAEKLYPETQCGFRANRSTTDMIFSLRQLQVLCF